MKTKIVAAILAASLLAGCASVPQQDQPVIDTKGVDPAKYAQDSADCNKFAGVEDPTKRAMTGAVAGAIIGGILGVIIAGPRGAAFGAELGGLHGGVGGGAAGMVRQRMIVYNCMIGRGYHVIG